MKRAIGFAAAGILLSFSALVSAQATRPASRPVEGKDYPAPSATEPVLQPRTDARHQQFLTIAKAGDIDLLFLGDSITDFWRQTTRNGQPMGKAVWDKYFAPLKAANFGISADRTQHVLFRVQNGELEGFKAKCIVMMLGTNNLTSAGPGAQFRNTADETIAGMKLVVAEIRKRQPDAKLLLLAIFPRGASPADPFREQAKIVNEALAKLDDGKNIFFMDINSKFLVGGGPMAAKATDGGVAGNNPQPAADGMDRRDGATKQSYAPGTLPDELFPDHLHPNEKGYQIWADTIIDKVKELMK